MEARVGKFLVPAGFLNTIHPHDWPMVARPLSLRYFTGDEGFGEDGVSVSLPIDLRSKTFLKASVDAWGSKIILREQYHSDRFAKMPCSTVSR